MNTHNPQHTHAQCAHTQHTHAQRTHTQRTHTQHTHAQYTHAQYTHAQRTHAQRTHAQYTHAQYTHASRAHLICLVLVVTLWCMPQAPMRAQTSAQPVPQTPPQTVWHIGAHGAYSASWHYLTQPVLAEGAGCGSFTYATGGGAAAGLLGEYELTSWLRGALRLSWSQLGGTSRLTCDNGIIVPIGDNQFAPLVREYTRTVHLDYALVEIGVRIQPFDFPLAVIEGFSIGAPVFRSTYDQSEHIISPPGALFPGYVTTRSNGGGELKDAKLRTAVLDGLGWTFTLHGGAELTPEIIYSHPLNDAGVPAGWRIRNMRAGVALTWPIVVTEEAPPPPPPPPPAPAPPPPPPPPPPPAPPIAHIGTVSDAKIDITETYVTETFPILPYVFFGAGSAELPAKYVSTEQDIRTRFSETDLPRKTLPIYQRILDIVGSRMRALPASRVTLIGSTDGKDDERADTVLALARARAVASYLTRTWGIDQKRMRIETRDLPPVPTSQAYAEGDEENRRVDIVADDPAIFRPVVHARFSEYDITPSTLEIRLGSDTAQQISAWGVTIRQGGEEAARFRGTGTPPAVLHWRIGDTIAARVRDGEALEAVFTVTDVHGVSGVSNLTIPVSKKRNAYEVGRLSLIVFDFDRADISPANKRMIRSFVAEAITPESAITITGSTDLLGEEKHNVELSAARAERVKELLLSRTTVFKSLDSRGIGEAPFLYDNNLPEGRFYCRTVSVNVETPLAR